MTVYLNVAQEFYKRPAARHIKDGSFSGELFRETLLKPKLDEAIDHNTKLEVDFSELTMAGSSFLDEAFGGLVRLGYFDKKTLLNTLIIKSKKDSWGVEAISYITEAVSSKK